MLNAIVLLNVERNKIKQVAEKLAAMDGVSEVHTVSGEFDLVAIIRVADNENMADVVADRLLKVEGIIKSQTLVSFRAYSRHDLDLMFSAGGKKA